MSFTLINTWAVGDSLTSAQQNNVAITLTKCLDKTTAGDTLSGVVNVAASGQIAANFAAGVQSNAVAGIRTNVGSGFQLGGGPGDWPTFSFNRSRTIVQPLMATLGSTNWTGGDSGLGVLGKGFGNQLQIPLLGLHNGATLTSVSMQAIVALHTGGTLTTVLPTFDVRRIAFGSNANASLLSGGPVNPGSPSNAAWYNSGNPQTWSATCNQNNVIDTSQYQYYVVLVDENIGGAGVANFYGPMSATYSTINDMRFP
jgi:hypothetical protein